MISFFQYILSKYNLCKKENIIPFTIFLGIFVYVLIYIYVIIYKQNYINEVNTYLVYIIMTDLALSTLLYSFTKNNENYKENKNEKSESEDDKNESNDNEGDDELSEHSSVDSYNVDFNNLLNLNKQNLQNIFYHKMQNNVVDNEINENFKKLDTINELQNELQNTQNEILNDETLNETLNDETLNEFNGVEEPEVVSDEKKKKSRKQKVKKEVSE
jgi:hypothetical protein